MKIKVYNSKGPRDKEVTLRLFAAGGGACVKAVDQDGVPLDSGCLLVINHIGVSLCQGVDGQLGFPTDSLGRLKVLE